MRPEDEVAFWIGDEINAASDGALSLPVGNARVLDLFMAPGLFTAAVHRHSPYAIVCALALPLNLGGHPVPYYKDTRVSVWYGDISMLHEEFGVSEIPYYHYEPCPFSAKRPWYRQSFDLIFCGGQAIQTYLPHVAGCQVEADRLRVSQLILAMQRIECGGTLIMRLYHAGSYETIKILSIFDKIAKIKLFKSVSWDKKRGSLYLIAKNVQRFCPEAVAAVNEWKMIWKELTFPIIKRRVRGEPREVVDTAELSNKVSSLLESFGTRAIELGEPIWDIQREALANTNWTETKKRETDGEQVYTAQASTAATGSAIFSVHDSEKDSDGAGGHTAVTDSAAVTVHDSKGDVDDAGDPANMDTAPVSRELSDSADVSAAMEKLDVHS